jgi:ATP-binding cassette subfamily F protein 3
MLNINKLSLHFGSNTLFEDLNLFVGPRERVGLIGKNGAGKSTLLRMIAGHITPSGGTISMPKESTVGFLEQDMPHNEAMTIIDEAATAFAEIRKLENSIAQLTQEITERTDYESESYHKLIEQLSEANERHRLIGGANAEQQAQRILQGLGFSSDDMHRKVGEFSGGWKMRVELAKLLLINPDLLLLDEPTNHLDIESIQWLEGFLRNYPGTIVLISHDKAFLDALTNRTVEVGGQRIYDFKAPYSKYMEWRIEELERQTLAAKNQQKYIEDTQRNIEKFRAKKNKAAFAQTLIRKLEKLERLEVDDFDNSGLRFSFPPAPRSGKVVVEAKQLSKSYGKLDVFKGVELLMARQEKIALVGKNGAGKTTLTRILIGDEQGEGECTLGHNVSIGYYAQNQADELEGERTVFVTIDSAAEGDIRTRVRSMLGAFLFSGEDIDKKVKVLSGGEKARLALCKLLLQPCNLLILDEPTNHLDMRSKEVLKQALIDYDGTMIVVSHDRDFLSGLTELVYEITPKGLKQYIGDIQAFLNERNAESIAAFEADTGKMKADASSSIPQNKNNYAERKEAEKQRRKLQNAVERFEKNIAEAEEKLSQLEAQLAVVDYSDANAAEALIRTHANAKAQLDQLYADWESAGEALMAFDKEEQG